MTSSILSRLSWQEHNRAMDAESDYFARPPDDIEEEDSGIDLTYLRKWIKETGFTNRRKGINVKI